MRSKLLAEHRKKPEVIEAIEQVKAVGIVRTDAAFLADQTGMGKTILVLFFLSWIARNHVFPPGENLPTLVAAPPDAGRGLGIGRSEAVPGSPDGHNVRRLESVCGPTPGGPSHLNRLSKYDVNCIPTTRNSTTRAWKKASISGELRVFAMEDDKRFDKEVLTDTTDEI